VVGRGTPEFLAHDFAPVKLGDEKDIIQVSDQFRPIFILDKPGTVAADILSDVAKLDQINVAIRLAEKDRKDAKATRRVREQDILDLRAALVGYDGLDGVVGRIAGLEESHRLADEIDGKVAKLDTFLEEIFSLGGQIRALREISDLEVPDISPVASGGPRFEKLEKLTKELFNKAEAVSALLGVGRIELPDYASFSSLAEVYDKLISWVSKAIVLHEFCERLQAVTDVHLPEMTTLAGAKESYQRLALWATRLQELAVAVVQAKEGLEEASQEKAALEDELGVCPLCNYAFDAEQGHCRE
jgi:hypothetical protein